MTPAQCKAARALIGMTQPELAKAAGLGLSTIVDFEKERRVLPETTKASIMQALEDFGIHFTADIDGSLGVLFAVPSAKKIE